MQALLNARLALVQPRVELPVEMFGCRSPTTFSGVLQLVEQLLSGVHRARGEIDVDLTGSELRDMSGQSSRQSPQQWIKRRHDSPSRKEAAAEG